ncbi:MAG TPA: PPC domain-containing DNA-binding protein [Bryobacteraceae bacterium]|jgi:predicted DNA-binding protein with PD1-like motif|nr:PPC domain-containing DNA-binding protein [Bryobacteraceae bacterium]
MTRIPKATWFLLPLLLTAQISRHEITTAVSPEDSKPNSEQVPAAYAIPTQFERVVVLRFKYDTDLLAGLEQMVKQQKIRNGVILNGFGSVRNYQIHQVSNRTLPSKNTFVKDPTGPADIAAMSGYVLNGRLHPHITLATPDRAFGGHLEPGTNVFTFAVVTIGVLPDGLDLGKLDDKNYR